MASAMHLSQTPQASARHEDMSAYDSDSSSTLSSPPSATASPSPEVIQEINKNLQQTNYTRNAYPSPPRSQECSDSSQSGSPSPDEAPSAMNSDKDGPPPRKRRRVSERAPRTTEYLDLRTGTVDPSQQPQLDRLLNVLHKRQKIVVVAGAGISVSAGIPDFRSSTGLFTSLRAQHNLKGSGKDLFDASVVYNDASSTASFHDMVRTMSIETQLAKPTPFHHMLATLAQQNRLLRLYSQNVDGIDTRLEPLKTRIPLSKDDDGKWPKTVQLHGGLDKMVCSKCRETNPFQPELFEGPVPPVCKNCMELDDLRTKEQGRRSHGVGMLRPRMVLYNEHNPDDEAIGSVCRDDLRKRPDAIVVVGTTLKVPGVKRIVREMCATVRDRKDGVAIWINNDPEPSGREFDHCWDIVVRAKCDTVATLAALGQWDRQNDAREVSVQSVERASRSHVEIHIEHNSTFKPPNLRRTPMPSPTRPPFSPMSHHGNSAMPLSLPESLDPSDAAPETPSRRKSRPSAKSEKSAGLEREAKAHDMFTSTNKATAAQPKKGGRKAKPAAATKKAQANKTAPTPQTTLAFKAQKAIPSRTGKAGNKVKDIVDAPIHVISPGDARINRESTPTRMMKSTVGNSEEERVPQCDAVAVGAS